MTIINSLRLHNHLICAVVFGFLLKSLKGHRLKGEFTASLFEVNRFIEQPCQRNSSTSLGKSYTRMCLKPKSVGFNAYLLFGLAR
jgi:hypothetical protein